MRQYNIFQAIFMSFYSRRLYRDVGRHWGGKTFLYLFVLLTLSWIGATIQIQSGLNRLYSKVTDNFVAQIPVMTIKQGKLSTPDNKPYIIKDPNAKKIFAIIDTSGKYSDISKGEAEILVTETTVIDRPDSDELRIHKIPTAFSAVINPITINAYVKHGIGFAWVFIFTFLVLFSYVYRIMQTLIYGIIGKIFSMVSGSNVSYGTILQITMVAITPSIILATVLDIFMISFRFEYLAYFVISMLYMFYGIRANKT